MGYGCNFRADTRYLERAFNETAKALKAEEGVIRDVMGQTHILQNEVVLNQDEMHQMEQVLMRMASSSQNLSAEVEQILTGALRSFYYLLYLNAQESQWMWLRAAQRGSERGFMSFMELPRRLREQMRTLLALAVFADTRSLPLLEVGMPLLLHPAVIVQNANETAVEVAVSFQVPLVRRHECRWIDLQPLALFANGTCMTVGFEYLAQYGVLHCFDRPLELVARDCLDRCVQVRGDLALCDEAQCWQRSKPKWLEEIFDPGQRSYPLLAQPMLRGAQALECDLTPVLAPLGAGRFLLTRAAEVTTSYQGRTVRKKYDEPGVVIAVPCSGDITVNGDRVVRRGDSCHNSDSAEYVLVLNDTLTVGVLPLVELGNNSIAEMFERAVDGIRNDSFLEKVGKLKKQFGDVSVRAELRMLQVEYHVQQLRNNMKFLGQLPVILEDDRISLGVVVGIFLVVFGVLVMYFYCLGRLVRCTWIGLCCRCAMTSNCLDAKGVRGTRNPVELEEVNPMLGVVGPSAPPYCVTPQSWDAFHNMTLREAAVYHRLRELPVLMTYTSQQLAEKVVNMARASGPNWDEEGLMKNLLAAVA